MNPFATAVTCSANSAAVTSVQRPSTRRRKRTAEAKCSAWEKTESVRFSSADTVMVDGTLYSRTGGLRWW